MCKGLHLNDLIAHVFIAVSWAGPGTIKSPSTHFAYNRTSTDFNDLAIDELFQSPSTKSADERFRIQSIMASQVKQVVRLRGYAAVTRLHIMNRSILYELN